MKIAFHGAARCVTGSKHIITLKNGKKILLDCGLFQGMGKETDSLNRYFGFDPASIDEGRPSWACSVLGASPVARLLAVFSLPDRRDKPFVTPKEYDSPHPCTTYADHKTCAGSGRGSWLQ